MKKLGIYIHIPFCEKKCNYCDFNSHDNLYNLQPAYLKALTQEIKNSASSYKDHVIDTVFIGGGTPSFLFKGAIATILSVVKKHYNVLKDVEITIECNPGSVTYEKAFEWKTAGVNRVSVGLQSASEKILKIIGRTHTKLQYITAINTLNQAGFININTDIMIGLPSQKQSHIKHAIQLAKSNGSTHISCYSLILEKNTPLYSMAQRGNVSLPKEEKVLDAYNFVVRYLKELGYMQYEISNFAIKGYECQHNLNCWNMQEYIGFGAGAHSYVGEARYNNIKDINSYIKNIKLGKAVKENIENVKNEWLDEYIMLALRTTKGIDVSKINKKLNIDFLKTRSDVITELQKHEMIILKDGFIRSTPQGFYVSNYIINKLI